MIPLVPYDFVPPLKDIYSTTHIFKEDGYIGDRDEECGLLKVGEDVTPRDPKGEGGYEDIKFSKSSGRYYCVHE